MGEDTERPEASPVIRSERGILSERDRKFCLDTLGVESGSAHERMIRKDIRERLLNALLDFRLLLQHLRDDDLARVVDNLATGKDHKQRVFADGIAFLYRAVRDRSEWDFEEILRDGIHLGADHSGEVIRGLRVEVDAVSAETDELLQALEHGDGITLSEFGHLLRSGTLPRPNNGEEVSFHMEFPDATDGDDEIRIRFERE